MSADIGNLQGMVEGTAGSYKEHVEKEIARLAAEAAQHTGKENHKLRASKGKMIATLRSEPRYIDACRVVRGLPPSHGYFAKEAPQASEADTRAELSPESAARVAAEVNAQLAEMGPPPPPPDERPPQPETDQETMESAWAERLSMLEAKMAQPREVPPVDSDDIDELQAIAQEIVDYREMLQGQGGYRNRDVKDTTMLPQLEERLDVLSAAMLPEEREEDKDEATKIEEIREWEKRLLAKAVKHHKKEFVGASPSEAKEIERLWLEVAELKAQLRREGLNEHQQDKDERVFMRMLRLKELTQFKHNDKLMERRTKKEADEIKAEVAQVQVKLDQLKHSLMEEHRMTQSEVKEHAAIVELEERLQVLRGLGGA